jgi:hypothetical protein
VAADLDRERLELERERLQAEIRHKEAALELEQRRFEASIPRAEPPSWRGTLKATMLATAPLLTALIAPTLGLVQFGYSQVQSAKASATARTREAELRAETARQEASRAFNAKRLALYEKAISVTGKLASEPIGSDGFKRARRQFESFYWSQLPLVENEGVSNAMAELRTGVINGDAAEINQGVIELAKAVRADLREIYGR